MLTLKQYQQRTLDTLAAYFQACLKFGNTDTAFYEITRQRYGTGIAYVPVRELPDLPYVCLRLPTGGGKTLVAAHAVGIAARELLHTDHPLALWLTPSDAIRQQTLKAFKNPAHPYRQAVESQAGTVDVLDISEARFIQPATLTSGVTLIIATMQAFRVEDTDGRKVYEASGSLMDHFSGLPEEALQGIERFENGRPVTSLANVLRLHRPIVIVDEAHNSRTDLSFDTLARFNPSCILEFTATPARTHNPSNVLHTVSAAELKTEGMVKLPIRLETHQDWKEVVSHAVAARNQLEETARLEKAETGEYIRPIVLLQAQPRDAHRQTLTVEVLENSLLQDHHIPANQIARATGEDKDLEDVDLADATCPIRYVITVQALREGWDCPFAYVLCTVAALHNPRAVEQILGRILRLPRAQAKRRPELNRAYAFATSPHFDEAARALTDALVENGFERQEVKDLVTLPPAETDLPLFRPLAVSFAVARPPSLQGLAPHLAAKVSYDAANVTLTVKESLTPDEVYALKACFSDLASQQAVENACQPAVIEPPTRPAGREKLSIPLLAIKQGDFFEQFEETCFLDHPWNLAKRDPYLSEEDFPTNPPEGGQGEIDVTQGGRVQTHFLRDLQDQMALLAADQGWSAINLGVWLDRNLYHVDIPVEQSLAFMGNGIEALIQKRGLTLTQLVTEKFRLKNAIEAKIQEYRQQAHSEAYQSFLLPDSATPLSVGPEICFTYDPDPMNYPCSPESLYPGKHTFQKHYYPVVGNLKPQGEEYECAQFLDWLPEVKVWVRNLERRPQHSFWLQTATDKFYPDFVCKLADDRYLVVEYKGHYLWSNQEEQEKLRIGTVWEEKSGGKCLFVMPDGKDFDAIRAKVK